MKCNQCGFEHDNINNLEVVHNAMMQYGSLSKQDVLDLGEKLNLKERQVRNYVKVLKEHDFDDAVAQLHEGVSINALASCNDAKSTIAKAYKLIKKDYDISFELFQQLLEEYQK